MLIPRRVFHFHGTLGFVHPNSESKNPISAHQQVMRVPSLSSGVS